MKLPKMSSAQPVFAALVLLTLFVACQSPTSSGGSTSVPVTGVSLSPTSLALTVGDDTSTLTATVSPASATNKAVSWTSSATSVATVSSAGVVAPVAAGTATITATTSDGNFTASATVTVIAPSSSITLSGILQGAWKSDYSERLAASGAVVKAAEAGTSATTDSTGRYSITVPWTSGGTVHLYVGSGSNEEWYQALVVTLPSAKASAMAVSDWAPTNSREFEMTLVKAGVAQPDVHVKLFTEAGTEVLDDEWSDSDGLFLLYTSLDRGPTYRLEFTSSSTTFQTLYFYFTEEGSLYGGTNTTAMTLKNPEGVNYGTYEASE